MQLDYRLTHARQSVHGAVEDGGDLTYFVGEGGEFFGEDGLHAIGEGFVRLMVDFDEKVLRELDRMQKVET